MGRRSGILVVIVLLVAAVAAIAVFAYDQVMVASTPKGPGPVTESNDVGIPPGATEAIVEYVHDGDTLFLADGRKVRLLGVDTPEIGDHTECYGDEATALLRSLLPEGTRVHVLSDVQPFDQYDRFLLLVWLAASEQEAATFVNLALIEQGAAEAVVLEPNVLYAADFEAAEDAAQDAGAGRWGACG